jgi:CHAT domain-containing protein
MGQYQQAVDEYDKAERIFREHGLAVDVARCQANRAGAREQMGQYQQAVDEYKNVDVSRWSDDDKVKYHGGYGEALWQTGQQEESLEQFTQGRHCLRRARRTGGIDETSLEFVAERQGLVRRAVRHALEAKDDTLAFEAVQDGKAGVLGDLRGRNRDLPEESDEVRSARKSLTDAMRARAGGEVIAAAKQGYFKLWRAAQVAQTHPSSLIPHPNQVSLTEIQRALPPDWALLDFWVLNDEEVRVFIVRREDTLKMEPLGVPLRNAEVQRALGNLMLWHGGFPAGDDALDTFYHLLWKPLARHLEGVKGVYLVPHGYLHLVPLHACRDEEGELLRNKRALAYLPSASLLPQLPKLSLNSKMLTLANPHPQTRQTLPFSEWEAEQLKGRLKLPHHQVWMGKHATLDKTQAWAETPIAHFTCHGSADVEFAPLSYLSLADDLLLAHDVVYRQPPLPEGALAILNGCQTGVRDWRAVDEGLGLMSAFLLRGAGLVLGTHWSVDDHCAAEMVTTFTTELVQNGANPTDALNAAQERVFQITEGQVEEWCNTLKETKYKGKEFGHEVAALNKRATRACLRSGNLTGAKHYAREAVALLRSVRRDDEADNLEEQVNEAERQNAEKKDPNTPAYTHPMYWSAFYLVGRVT